MVLGVFCFNIILIKVVSTTQEECGVFHLEEFKMNISFALFSNYGRNGRSVNTLDQYPNDFFSSGPFFTLQ